MAILSRGHRKMPQEDGITLAPGIFLYFARPRHFFRSLVKVPYLGFWYTKESIRAVAEALLEGKIMSRIAQHGMKPTSGTRCNHRR